MAQPENVNVESISIELPLTSYSTDSKNYGLVIIDRSGTSHYFNEDGSYDGWSKETNISLN